MSRVANRLPCTSLWRLLLLEVPQHHLQQSRHLWVAGASADKRLDAPHKLRRGAAQYQVIVVKLTHSSMGGAGQISTSSCQTGHL